MAARFAQHFLVNQHAAQRIVEALRLEPDDVVLEIGPGRGVLTSLVLREAKHVIAVEIDAALVAYLKQHFRGKTNMECIQGDILDYDLTALPKPMNKEQAFVVVGNLPYNLTSPILQKLSDWAGWSRASLMVQKEVGDRLCASVNSSDYGAMTVGLSLTCTVEPLMTLSESSFRPAPKVKSKVVLLKRRPQPLSKNIERVQRVIQAAFQQRRKTILNSLSHGLKISKEKVLAELSQLAIPPTLRAENIRTEQFIELSGRLLG